MKILKGRVKGCLKLPQEIAAFWSLASEVRPGFPRHLDQPYYEAGWFVYFTVNAKRGLNVVFKRRSLAPEIGWRSGDMHGNWGGGHEFRHARLLIVRDARLEVHLPVCQTAQVKWLL